MDASLQRSMSIRHCVPRWCTLSVYKNQVIWASRPNDAEPSIEATLRFAPHCLIIFVRTTNKKPKQETYMRRNILIYTIIAALFLIAYSFNRVQNNNICAQQQTNYLNDIAKPFIEKNQEKYRLWQSTIGKSHQSDYPRTWLGASHQFSFTIQQYRSLELLPSNIIDDIIMKIELESKKWKSCP